LLKDLVVGALLFLTITQILVATLFLILIIILKLLLLVLYNFKPMYGIITVVVDALTKINAMEMVIAHAIKHVVVL
jgi:hypothetical protein